MREIKGQIMASTQEDRHGERYDKTFFEEMIQSIEEGYDGILPLGQMHDPSKPNTGYAKNLRLIEDPESEGDWNLIADVFMDESALEIDPKGFSFSSTVLHEKSRREGDYILYLPFPHYRDPNFFEQLHSRDSSIVIGKWIKKSADPATAALLTSAVIFTLTPLWNEIFKEEIWPRLTKAFQHFPDLQERNISVDLVQPVKDEQGRKFDIYFIPEKGHETSCFNEVNVANGIEAARIYLETDEKAKEIGAKLVKLKFDIESLEYKLYSVQYRNAEVKYFFSANA